MNALDPYTIIWCKDRYCVHAGTGKHATPESTCNGGELEIGRRSYCTGGFCEIASIETDKASNRKRVTMKRSDLQ